MIKQQGITIVDFWAPWCGPCKAISPVLDQIMSENSDIDVVKINVDDVNGIEQETLLSESNVRAIPYMAIFKDGECVDNIVGAVPKSHIIGVVDKYR